MTDEIQKSDEYFGVDLLRLHEEWRDQSQHVYNAATEAALRRRDFDRAEEDCDKKGALLKSDMRANPANHGIVKVTEESLKEALQADIEYRAACRRVSDARYAMNMADAAVLALEHKKRALTKLVDLYVNEYYSEPSRGRSLDEALQRKRRVIDEDLQREQLTEDRNV